eukprot:gene417-1053_t
MHVKYVNSFILSYTIQVSIVNCGVKIFNFKRESARPCKTNFGDAEARSDICLSKNPKNTALASRSSEVNEKPDSDMLGEGINNSSNTNTVGPVAGKRPKVLLKRGRSLMDWIRLGTSGSDLQGFGGKLKTVSMKELAKHNKEDDCWMLLRGNVYNITAYTEYHPGGISELMRGAGKDGTQYFDEVHKWVNIESMLAKCLIGPIEQTAQSRRGSEALSPKLAGPSSPQLSNQDEKIDTTNIIPRYEWFQNESSVMISIYTKRKHITSDSLIIDCEDGKTFNCKVLLGEKYYQIHIMLEKVISSFQVHGTANSSGKLEIRLMKSSLVTWTGIGEKLNNDNKSFDEKDRELTFRSCKVCAIDRVSPDTKLFSIELPDRVYYRTPIGHHCLLEGEVQYKLQIGDAVSVSDCTGNFQLARLLQAKFVYMIAAGTGLTPMLRIIDFTVKDVANKRKTAMLFANRHESDILWRKELDTLVENNRDTFNVEYILSKPSEGWNGFSGRINKDILFEFLANAEKPEHEEDLLICICGSEEFTELMKGPLSTHFLVKTLVDKILSMLLFRSLSGPHLPPSNPSEAPSV